MQSRPRGVKALPEQARSTKVRGYQMTRRADDVAETRRRIVAATVTLHEEVGLAATSISAIAETAGVTRLTVYRHFPETSDLFFACSSHWMAMQRMPDPDAWAMISEPGRRTRVGLTDLYRYFREGERMLRNVRADFEVLPVELRDQIQSAERRYASVLEAAFPRRHRGRSFKAAIGHAISFSTWDSLVNEQGLSDREAVELMGTLIQASANPRRR